MTTRCAQLRCAGDRHGPIHADPLRPASLRWRSSWTYSCRPAAPSFAALAIVMDLFMPTRCAQLRCAGDRHGPIHADPLRPASLRWRSSWTYSCRPAAPSFAALAIVMDLFMPTRCAQLRCAGDRHGPIHADPLRPASLRWRSSWTYSCRPAAPSFAALAIVMDLFMPTRCAQLRCAGDRHGPIHADPLRPASLRWRSSWTYSCRPAAPSFAALAIVMDLFMPTRCAQLRCAGDRHGPIHADPLRPASLRWRSSWTYSCRPAAPSFAALAIVMDLFMPTRCAQLRCAGDRHGPIHADPLRPASLRWRSSWTYSCRPAAPSFAALAIVMDLFMPTRCAQLRCACDRHGLILLGVPTAVWPKREFAVRLGVSRGFRQFGLHHSRGFGQPVGCEHR